MAVDLTGIRVAVVGGDDRELVLIPELVRCGALVKACGFSPREELKGADLTTDVGGALAEAGVVIMPMPGTDDTGLVRAIHVSYPVRITEELLSQLAPGTPIFIGTAKPFLRRWMERLRLRLIEIAEMDEIAIYNSIPTAEGAIQLAMQELPITIHGSSAFVLGFGRIGKTLARTLLALGAKTTVVARRPRDLARGYEMGLNTLHFARLGECLGQADVVFNTVPALVLDQQTLSRLKKDALVIDLASQPGGTDFQAAAGLGLKAMLAPGLPGKVAPKTAGEILARVVPSLIFRELAAE